MKEEIAGTSINLEEKISPCPSFLVLVGWRRFVLLSG